jgi:hypothetical protein
MISSRSVARGHFNPQTRMDATVIACFLRAFALARLPSS